MREVVEYQDPSDEAPTYTGDLRQIVVTAYRTQQRIRSAVFAVPADLDADGVNAYLERTFAWLGLYEIFDQEERFCIRDDLDDVTVDDIADEPETGYEWREMDEEPAV